MQQRINPKPYGVTLIQIFEKDAVTVPNTPDNPQPSTSSCNLEKKRLSTLEGSDEKRARTSNQHEDVKSTDDKYQGSHSMNGTCIQH